MKSVWIARSNDEYELPIAIADTASELARMVGVHHTVIWNCVARAEKLNSKSKYDRVYIDDDEV